MIDRLRYLANIARNGNEVARIALRFRDRTNRSEDIDRRTGRTRYDARYLETDPLERSRRMERFCLPFARLSSSGTT